MDPAQNSFRSHYFPSVPDLKWNNWKWQMRNRISHFSQLEKYIQLSPKELEIISNNKIRIPLGITPHYLSLIDPINVNQPLRKTVIPNSDELIHQPEESEDPLCEISHSRIPGLIHRYPDRVLFLVHDFCATYCRYCTRSRTVGHGKLKFFKRSSIISY